MISEDDAPYTIDYDTFYAVNPAIHNWHRDPDRQLGGKTVPEGFRYTSDVNTWWLTKQELRGILENYRVIGPELVHKEDIDPNDDRLADEQPMDMIPNMKSPRPGAPPPMLNV